MTTLITTPATSVPVVQSGMFLPPGRPRPLARRLAIHNFALRRIRQFLEDRGFQEIPVPGPDPRQHLATMLGKGFPAVWCETLAPSRVKPGVDNCLPRFKLITVLSASLDLAALDQLMASLLKDVTRTLGAELLGGRQVTRLDRTVQGSLPRLTHTEAVTAVRSRGWDLQARADLTPEIEATLVRHCGNLPVMITHWPAHLKSGLMEAEPGLSARIKCIVPYAGEIMDGGIWQSDIPQAGFGLGVGRLLQYLMGLGSVTDTVVVPDSGPGRTGAQAAE